MVETGGISSTKPQPPATSQLPIEKKNEHECNQLQSIGVPRRTVGRKAAVARDYEETTTNGAKATQPKTSSLLIHAQLANGIRFQLPFGVALKVFPAVRRGPNWTSGPRSAPYKLSRGAESPSDFL